MSVPTAETYTLRWKPRDSDVWEIVEWVEDYFYTVPPEDVVPNMLYEGQVKSLCENGESAYSNSVVFINAF